MVKAQRREKNGGGGGAAKRRIKKWRREGVSRRCLCPQPVSVGVEEATHLFLGGAQFGTDGRCR